MDDNTSAQPDVDYPQASADLKRYLPLKLTTLVWFIAVFGLGVYAIAATWSGWWPYTALDVPNLDAAKPAIYAFFSGLLGASVYAFRGFYWAVGPQSKTNRRYQYDPNWTLWYVARPIMGAILGVFSFALLRAGVATLGSGSTDAGATAAYFAVAFLAGFAVTEVLNWITVSAQRVFAVRQDADAGADAKNTSSGEEQSGKE